jgi:class 3 adenylate cyclase
MERRAAAILDADVAGYSRLVEAFEQETHDRLRSVRETVIDPALKASEGSVVVKHTGDGFLAVFPAPLQAVRFALAVQDAVRRHEAQIPPDQALALRIGISYGDILLEGADAFGNEVNVAARLQ